MITYTSTEGGKKGFWPLFEVQPQALAPMIQDIEKVSERINRCLFVDTFMAITKMQGVQPRNELELTKRDLERLQVLGPFVELFETEFASPAIRRVLDIMERRRMLRPMPDSLKNVPLKINYVSIMRLAQRSAESIAMKDTFVTMGQLSAAAKAAGVPDPIRVFDLDKSARKYGELNNYPADCLFTDEQVKQHDQAREQAKAQAQAPGAAMAGVQAAKTLVRHQGAGRQRARGAARLAARQQRRMSLTEASPAPAIAAAPIARAKPPKDWLSRKEAAIYLSSIGCRISPRTLDNLAANNNAGKGPPFKRFRWNRVQYMRVNLDAWAKAECVEVT
jgi:hypothetical protein